MRQSAAGSHDGLRQGNWGNPRTKTAASGLPEQFFQFTGTSWKDSHGDFTVRRWTSCSPAHRLKPITCYSLYMYFYFIVITFVQVINTRFCSTSNTCTFLTINREKVFSERLSITDVIWQTNLLDLREKSAWWFRRELFRTDCFHLGTG